MKGYYYLLEKNFCYLFETFSHCGLGQHSSRHFKKSASMCSYSCCCIIALCIITKHKRCTTFLGQGPQFKLLVLVHSRAEDKIVIWTFESQLSKTKYKISWTTLFVACGLILLPSKLFQILISYKIVNRIQWSLNSLIKLLLFRRRFLYF